ncbi:MAG: ABC transporter permease, partial [Clostridia bacterium]|nr:ABC transporter permease [Clostridia bacterium]
AVILLVSLLVVAIALMCIRFTLLTKIEDDYREIGVMKAIGLQITDIKRIYLAKYAAVAAVGSILGYGLSWLFRGMLLENIRLYMGASDNSNLAMVLGTIGILFVFTAVVAYVNGVLKRFKNISPAEAIRFGTSQDKAFSSKHFTLGNNKIFDTNVFLGVKDVLSRSRLYLTMLTVLVLTTFIMIVPQNMSSTISSKAFIQYMGIGNCDIRLDIQQAENASQKAAQIQKVMGADASITQFAVFTTKTFKTKLKDGSEERLKVELGDHSKFPIKYSAGRAPESADEMALSDLNARELDIKVGDSLTLLVDGKETKLRITGVYSDITNGGKTAKAVLKDDSAPTMWCVIYAELKDKSQIRAKVSHYSTQFSDAKVSGIKAYADQTFSGTKNAIRTASLASMVVAIVLAVLVTLLFMKMLVAKDRYAIAVLKASGYTGTDITLQYVSRAVFILIIGMIAGTLLANTLGEVLAGAAIASSGVSSFKFIVNPVSAYLFSPVIMGCSVLAAAIMGSAGASKIRIAENIKE